MPTNAELLTALREAEEERDRAQAFAQAVEEENAAIRALVNEMQALPADPETEKLRELVVRLESENAYLITKVIEARQWHFRDQPRLALEALTGLLDLVGADYPGKPQPPAPEAPEGVVVVTE